MSIKGLPADQDKPVADKPASKPQKKPLLDFLPDHSKAEASEYGPHPKP